ncbi:hypothetical protein RvY_08731-2 [Ramazzottius varieornatus]|uniref:Uncharacterized protein n=1 Tax=Ramazzottius varieornatus TaxID=947166 RepID=A0A1D1V703_RAMVA|nr:hypothetical protein RvY_08731-2 [Ramazzottius varieornatus]
MEILSSHDRDEEEDVFRSQYCDLLCFLTFHRNNVQEAREFAKRSYASNKLSLQACTNLGSVEYAEANYAEALHYFQEAAMLNSADFRSSYYAGMALKGLGNPQDAMTIFQKLYSAHGQRPTVLFQIAQLYEEAEQFAEAFAFFEKIFALYPGEPLVLQRLGQLAHKLGDTGAALWYYNESHRVCPTNLEVLNWLGRFFVTSQFPEKAITYFAQAADLEPQTAKWGLLMANAMRRAGHLTDAYNAFVDLHHRFPDNIDCLKLLIRMSQELQVAPTDIAKYQKELQFVFRQGSSVEAAPVSRASTASITQNFGDGRLTTGRKATSGLPTSDYQSLKNVSLDLDDSDLAAFAEVRPPTASTRNMPKLARPPTGRNKPVQDDEDIATAGILPGFPSHR